MKRSEPDQIALPSMVDFADGLITLKVLNSDYVRQSAVSKFLVTRASEPLGNLFSDRWAEDKNGVVLHFPNEDTLNSFVSALAIVHGQKLHHLPGSSLISILKLSSQYLLYEVIDKIAHRFHKLQVKSSLISCEEGISLLEIELPMFLPSTHELRLAGKSALTEKYLKFSETLNSSSAELEYFLCLPVSALLAIYLENPKIRVDSENTMIFVLYLWYCRDSGDRLSGFERLVSTIDLSMLGKNFFLDFVGHLANSPLPASITDLWFEGMDLVESRKIDKVYVRNYTHSPCEAVDMEYRTWLRKTITTQPDQSEDKWFLQSELVFMQIHSGYFFTLTSNVNSLPESFQFSLKASLDIEKNEIIFVLPVQVVIAITFDTLELTLSDSKVGELTHQKALQFCIPTTGYPNLPFNNATLSAQIFILKNLPSDPT